MEDLKEVLKVTPDDDTNFFSKLRETVEINIKKAEEDNFKEISAELIKISKKGKLIIRQRYYVLPKNIEKLNKEGIHCALDERGVKEIHWETEGPSGGITF
jgi:hypothetical protein